MEETDVTLPLHHKLNGALNALAKSSTQPLVAVAGREVLKILQVDDEEITEKVNLRVGHRLNLNFSSNDVDWGIHTTSNKLATAATNGSIILWNLERANQKVERIITEHNRSVNKILFNKNNGHLLISASQDGSLKLWDLRLKNNATLTMGGKAESVRDVDFNPIYQDQIVASFENGSIQLLDFRFPTVFKRVNAHYGIALTVKWHWDGKTIASGGRDKLIKIWDMKYNESLPKKPINQISTIAPVSNVSWRPNTHLYHLASCSLLSDYRVLIWDLKRPCVPFLALDFHTNVTTDFLWHDENHLWSCSKDKNIIVYDVHKDSVITEELFNKKMTSWLPNDEVLIVSTNKPLDADISINNISKRFLDIREPRQNYDPDYRKPANISTFIKCFVTLNSISWLDYLGYFAVNYRYKIDQNNTLFSILKHNKKVAADVGLKQIEKFWEFVIFIFSKNTLFDKYTNFKILNNLYANKSVAENSASSTPLASTPSSIQPTVLKSNSTFTAGDFAGPDEWLDGLELFDQDPALINEELSDPSLFPLHIQSSEQSIEIEKETPSKFHTPDKAPTNKSNHKSNDLKSKSGSFSFLGGKNYPFHDPGEMLLTCLDELADSGDVQTPTLVLITLKISTETIPKWKQLLWFDKYIELLNRKRLWEYSNDIINQCPFSEISTRNQASTTFHTTCNNCFKPMNPSDFANSNINPSFWFCRNCFRETNPCSICRLPVKGLYSWCQGCGHGGHMNHIFSWFESNSECPTGCGHNCSFA